MNSVQHDMPGKLWCGPAILSAITNRPTSEVTRVAFRYANLPPEEGIPWWAMDKVIREYGHALHFTGHETGKLRDVVPYSLSIVDSGRGHWVLTQDGLLVDSGNGTPVPIADTRFVNADVRWRWSVVPWTKG